MTERPSLPRGRRGASRRYAMTCAWHPGIMLAYVLAIVVMVCAVPNASFLLIALIGGSALLLQTDGPRGLRTLGGALVLGCAVTVLAPFFDAAGDRAIFSYFGRPYTFEALMRGAVAGLLAAAMIVWFACLFRTVSSDGLLQVCGRVAPRIGMVSSLVMQMVPRLSRRAARVRSARIGAGLAPSGGDVGARLREAGAVFSTVASDSLERSIVCADAMESRGYGTGARTGATLKPFAVDERAFIASAAVLFAGMCASALVQAMSGLPEAFWISSCACALFMLLPALFNVAEDVRWRI